MTGDEYGLLRAFVAVAEDRSFTRAATKLGISRSALSHAVRKLEERYGVRLLTRTTRSVAPTETGSRLLSRMRPALLDMEESLAELGQKSDRPSGRLRLLASAVAIRTVLAPKLMGFARDNPEVTLEIVSNSASTDLVASGFDAGVHLGEFVDQDMLSIRVSRDHRAAIVASPRYFETHAAPTVPRDLARHRCIGVQLGSGVYQWEFEKRGRSLTVKAPWAMIVDDPDLSLRAALDGVGIVYLFEEYVTAHLASGALVRVLEDWCAPFAGYYLYYPNVRHKSAALEALIEALRK